MKSSSLQSRIVLVMWVITTLSTVTAAFASGVLLIRSHRESVRGQLQASVTSMVSLGISDFSELKDFEQLDLFIENALQIEKVGKIIRIYDQTGKLVFSSVKKDYDQFQNHLDLPIKKPQFVAINGLQRQYESLVFPYRSEKNRHSLYLQVAIPLPKYTEILNSLWWQSTLLLLFFIGISLFLANRLTRRLLKPVGQVAEHLQKMDPTDIEGWSPLKLDERGHYLKAIEDGINTLSDRTREAVLQIRKMSRYVAHEMRTPLTILRGEAENTLSNQGTMPADYQKVLKSSLEEIQRMSEIVDTVLQIGERARTMPLWHPVSLNLSSWLMENKEVWEKTLGRILHVKIPSKLKMEVQTDPKLLNRLVDNLVRNIGHHTPPETQCTLSVTSQEKGIVLTVSDNGPGLPPSAIDSLNLIGRASKAAGIGLHLCFTIVEICNMHLQFSNEPGGGLQVKIYF